jgi:hypothetical protein
MAVPAYVNGVTRFDNSYGPTYSDLPSFSCTTGNTIVVMALVYQSPSRTITGVSDTAGNSYSSIGTYTPGDGANIAMFAAYGITGNASNVIRVSFSGNFQVAFTAAVQLEGELSLDSGYTPAGNDDSTSPYTTTEGTTGGNDRIVVGAFFDAIDSVPSYSSSSPSVLRLTGGSNYFAIATNDAASSGSWSVSVAAGQSETHRCIARAFYVASAPSAAITGTATESIDESDIVAGGKTIIITLTGDTWISN